MLIAMGYRRNYIQRAFNVHEKNYRHTYNVTVIVDIMHRLRNHDKSKRENKKNQKSKSKPNENHSATNPQPQQQRQMNAKQIQQRQNLWQTLKRQLFRRNKDGCPSHGRGEHLTFKLVGSTWDGFKLYLQCSQCADAKVDGIHIPRGFGKTDLFNGDSIKCTSTNHRQHNEEQFHPFPSHMTFQEAHKLSVYDKIDHRDSDGRFVLSTVTEKQGTKLKIHYDGWSKKWDIWSDFNKEIHRFAVAGSISKLPAHRCRSLKIGYYVDVNPSLRHPGWKCGEIRKLDRKSGQVQVLYEGPEQHYLYWTHLDDEAEIAEFRSTSKAKLLMTGYIRKNDSRIPKEIISLCFVFYGSIWSFNGNGWPRTRRDLFTDTLFTRYQELESLFLSLSDESFMKLGWDKLTARMQHNYDDTIQCVRSSIAAINATETSDADTASNCSKRARSEFEDSNCIESEPQKKKRKLRNESVEQ